MGGSDDVLNGLALAVVSPEVARILVRALAVASPSESVPTVF